MKKFIIICFICFIMLPTDVFSRNRHNHMKAFYAMKEVSIMFGGFGGTLSSKELLELHIMIDGHGGGKHRHNSTHNPVVISNSSKVIARGWNQKAVRNGVIIHNICDMADPGPDGTNNWEKNDSRHKKAIKLEKKILNGKRIIKFPVWAKKPGSEIQIGTMKKLYKRSKKYIVDKCTACSNTMTNIVSKKKKHLKQITSKIKIVVDNTPKCIKKCGGPIIYITWEGGSFTHRVITEGFDLNKEIEIALATSIGIISAAVGMKIGLIVCAPLEAFGGPCAHISSAIVISVGCGFAGEYAGAHIVKYVKIKYL